MNTQPEEKSPLASSGTEVLRARHVPWIGIALAGAIVLGLAAWQLLRSGTEPASLSRAYGFGIGNYRAVTAEASDPAPQLSGPKLGGGSLSLAEFRGKVVVVNLWGSWCGPCRREQPELERVWREYRERGVQFLGVNVRDGEVAARAFQEEFGVTYPSFFDPSAGLTFKLKSQVVPTTYVIDAEGNIAFRLTGRVDAALLRNALDVTLRKEGAGG
jgi:thiol-disulfide isomerase/thioredoxin